MITTINEFKKHHDYKIYHRTYGSAIGEVSKYLDIIKYDYNKDDVINAYIDGFFKPKEGETKKDHFQLYKGDKKVIEHLHVQIYNRGDAGFELNMYIN